MKQKIGRRAAVTVLFAATLVSGGNGFSQAQPAGVISPVVYLQPSPLPPVGVSSIWASRDGDDPAVVVLGFLGQGRTNTPWPLEVAVNWRNLATSTSGTAWVTAGTPLRVTVGPGPVVATTTSTQTIIPGAGVLAAS
ncbi:hypothetical protein [Nocardia sp. NPDC024068]|uniref:hypothetical protein n=1 Tax=Nocardia sp. NPDC024068 TaxID=3157197 RepID=UPI00340B66C1